MILTTGGLGPTADDLTAEVVGGFAGREMVLDEALEERILAILRRFRAPLALLQRGGDARGQPQAGDRARGRDDPRAGRHRARARRAAGGGDGPLVVVLPGPPWELRPMWAAAVETAPLRARARPGGHARAADAAALRRARVGDRAVAASRSRRTGVPLDRLEITTCLRRGEIEIATVFAPEAAPEYDAFVGGDPRAPRRHAVLRGRRVDRRAGRAAARRRARSRSPSRAPAG